MVSNNELQFTFLKQSLKELYQVIYQSEEEFSHTKDDLISDIENFIIAKNNQIYTVIKPQNGLELVSI